MCDAPRQEVGTWGGNRSAKPAPTRWHHALLTDDRVGGCHTRRQDERPPGRGREQVCVPDPGSLTSCLRIPRRNRGRLRTPPDDPGYRPRFARKCKCARVIHVAYGVALMPSAARFRWPVAGSAEGKRIPRGLFVCLLRHRSALCLHAWGGKGARWPLEACDHTAERVRSPCRPLRR